MKPFIPLFSACFWIACAGSFLMGAPRVALVIGNSKYDNIGKGLTSPVNDAQDIVGELRKLGYTIVSGQAVTNATREGMVNVIDQFRRQATGAEAAVFYFSGHGIQINDDNYLLPSDTPKLDGTHSLNERTIGLRGSVMQGLEAVNAQHKVIVLDCCRDNPFAAQMNDALMKTGKGIRTKSVNGIDGYGRGFYLAFATSPGDAALDGNGARNSPFTAAMLRVLPTSAGKDLDMFFREVKGLLPEEQVSWTNHSFQDSFSLAASGLLQEAATMVREANPSLAHTPANYSTSNPTSTPMTGSSVAALPTRGYFSLQELFARSGYGEYNNYTKEQILKDAQSSLKSAGLYSGDIDGDPGPGTQQGILAWQRNRNLPPTGLLDSATLDSMNLIGIAEATPRHQRPAFQPSSQSQSQWSQAPNKPGLFGGNNALGQIHEVTGILGDVSRITDLFRRKR